MISDIILQQVDQYGYLVFFLALCLGPFGIPVPNEITLLTGGILSNNGTLNPWMVYFSVLAGFLLVITCSYIAGRVFGEKFKTHLQRYRYFKKAEKLFIQHGDIAMSLAFFIPVVRYMFPLFAGLNGIPFIKFAIISYSSAIVWTSIFFLFGKFVVSHIGDIMDCVLDQNLLLLALMVGVSTFIIMKRRAA